VLGAGSFGRSVPKLWGSLLRQATRRAPGSHHLQKVMGFARFLYWLAPGFNSPDPGLLFGLAGRLPNFFPLLWPQEPLALPHFPGSNSPDSPGKTEEWAHSFGMTASASISSFGNPVGKPTRVANCSAMGDNRGGAWARPGGPSSPGLGSSRPWRLKGLPHSPAWFSRNRPLPYISKKGLFIL